MWKHEGGGRKDAPKGGQLGEEWLGTRPTKDLLRPNCPNTLEKAGESPKVNAALPNDILSLSFWRMLSCKDTTIQRLWIHRKIVQVAFWCWNTQGGMRTIGWFFIFFPFYSFLKKLRFNHLQDEKKSRWCNEPTDNTISSPSHGFKSLGVFAMTAHMRSTTRDISGIGTPQGSSTPTR